MRGSYTVRRNGLDDHGNKNEVSCLALHLGDRELTVTLASTNREHRPRVSRRTRGSMTTHENAKDPKDIGGAEIVKPDPKFQSFFPIDEG